MGVLVLPLQWATFGLKETLHSTKTCCVKTSQACNKISPIQPGITSKTNNRAAFKMNFRFQDEKETQGHELLGDTCSEQGPMPKKGPKEEPKNRGSKGGRAIHSSTHKLSPNVCVEPGFVLSSRPVTMNESELLPQLDKGGQKSECKTCIPLIPMKGTSWLKPEAPLGVFVPTDSRGPELAVISFVTWSRIPE